MPIQSSGFPAVVGVYVTEQGALEGRTTSSIYVEAVLGALRDAGLNPRDVDGLVGAGPGTNPAGNQHGAYADLFGAPLRFYADTKVGASSPGAAIAVAASAIREGRASVVLVATASGASDVLQPTPAQAAARAAAFADSEFESLWGPTRVADYAMMARRHMHDYGTKPEHLAEVAVAARYHATLTPESVMGSRGPITIDDVLSSRMICDPLHLMDCCLVNNGGGAYVVTSDDVARGLPHAPIFLLGAGENYPFNDRHYARSMTGFDTNASAWQALAQAGLTHDDISLTGISDHFTINVIMELEDAGFCKKGEGGDFVQGGTLQLGGKLPTNTDGGYLSHSHAGGCGIFTMIESVKQLRHEAKGRQVEDATFALLRGTGGAMQASYTAILGRDIP
jgi:acetyl-CoA acetyltransferase